MILYLTQRSTFAGHREKHRLYYIPRCEYYWPIFLVHVYSTEGYFKEDPGMTTKFKDQFHRQLFSLGGLPSSITTDIARSPWQSKSGYKSVESTIEWGRKLTCVTGHYSYRQRTLPTSSDTVIKFYTKWQKPKHLTTVNIWLAKVSFLLSLTFC